MSLLNTSPAHTPGPWYADSDGIYSGAPGTRQHPLPDGVTWRVVGHGAIRSRKSDEELQANVNLIAAAPDLLAVLKDVAALLPVAGRLHPQDLRALQTRVVETIARAEGQS